MRAIRSKWHCLYAERFTFVAYGGPVTMQFGVGHDFMTNKMPTVDSAIAYLQHTCVSNDARLFLNSRPISGSATPRSDATQRSPREAPGWARRLRTILVARRSCDRFSGCHKLARVDLSGATQAICDVDSFLGGAWSPDSTIVFGSYRGLTRVSATGV